MIYRIYPPEELIENGSLTMPYSKSMLNRALMLAALTPGAKFPPELPAGEDCRDVYVMQTALELLLKASKGEETRLNLGESGTALRFLTAFCAARPGVNAILDGDPGLRRRPVKIFVDALRQLGAEIGYLGEEGFAPLKIEGRQLSGGALTIDPTVSSQYISALMLVAPTMSAPLKISFDGEPSSLPYIRMTAEMMRRQGAGVDLAPLSVEVETGGYVPREQPIEGDWSGAAFWLEVGALTAGWITLRNLPLPKESIQGDARAAEFFECLGVVTNPGEDEEENPIEGAVSLTPSPEVYGRLDLDLADYPDLAPALTVTCCMLGVPFRFVGLHSLAIKESDRLQALVEEMERVGVQIQKIRDFGLEWEGKRHPILTMPVFDPRGDHRLAMALAPVAAYIPGILLRDPECVAKSYPGYWDALRSLGFTAGEYQPEKDPEKDPE